MLATESVAKFQATVRTRVSAYDRTSAFLTAASTVLVVVITLLIGLWLTAPTPAPRGITVIPETDATGQEELTGSETDEPAEGELLESNRELVEELRSITLAVIAVQTDLENFDRGRKTGIDGIGPGPLDPQPTPPVVPDFKPAWDRWRIEYAATSAVEYMTILAHFDVTLGAVHKVGNQIDYVDDLLDQVPTITHGLREDEKRIYFLTGRSGLRRWEAAKVAAAGIDTQDKILVQFYSEAVVEKLTALEETALTLAGKNLEEVQQTLFRVRSTGSGYEFSVAKITY